MFKYKTLLFVSSFIVLVSWTSSSTLLKAQDDKQEAKNPAVEAVEAVGGRVMQISAQAEDVEVNVSLVGDKVNDELVANIAKIEHLVWLNLARTKITDAGLKPLSNLTGIQKLHLEQTGIGDAAMQHLSGLENLEYLNIYGTKVTDKGLEHLKSLKNLKKLYVWQTGVTEAGMKSLNEALPELQITAGVSLKAVDAEKKEGDKAEDKGDGGEKADGGEKTEDKNDDG